MNASDDGNIDLSGSGYRYILQDAEWVKKNTYNGPIALGKVDVLWIANNLGPYAGSEPVITLITVPDPPPEPVGPSDIDSILDAFIDQINVQQVVTVVAAAAGVSIGLVFLWWGARKVKAAFMKAFTSGKLRI